jgi:hypothetical protein
MISKNPSSTFARWSLVTEPVGPRNAVRDLACGCDVVPRALGHADSTANPLGDCRDGQGRVQPAGDWTKVAHTWLGK